MDGHYAQNITGELRVKCLDPTRNVRARGITVGQYHHGERLPAPFPAGWTAQRDGSLLSESGFTTMEIVSPVLKGATGIPEILNIFQILNDAGAKVSDSCGFHVHVGAVSVPGERQTIARSPCVGCGGCST